jgi:hypothetical protein
MVASDYFHSYLLSWRNDQKIYSSYHDDISSTYGSPPTLYCAYVYEHYIDQCLLTPDAAPPPLEYTNGMEKWSQVALSLTYIFKHILVSLITMSLESTI